MNFRSLFTIIIISLSPIYSYANGINGGGKSTKEHVGDSSVTAGSASILPSADSSRTSGAMVLGDSLIQNLPFRNLTKAVSILPGIDTWRGKLYFKGGLPDENRFMLNGADVTDVFSGGPGVIVPQDAVKQIEVFDGGFPAEYGGAGSGVVLTTMKTGGRRIHASLQLETDNYTGQGKESLGGYSYGYSDYSATLSGPVVSDEIRFFAAAENEFYRDPGALYGENPNPIFRNGIHFNGLIAEPQYTLAHPNAALSDTLNLNYPAGNSAGGQYDRYSYAGTLLFHRGGIRLLASGAYTGIFSQDPADISEIFDTQRLPVNRYRNGFGSIELSQVLTPKVSYDLNLNYVGSYSETGFDPLLGNNFRAYGAPASNPVLNNGSSYLIYAPWYIFGPTAEGGVSAYQPGTPLALNPKINSESSLGGRLIFNVSAGINRLKIGGEYRYYTIRQYAPGSVMNMYYSLNQTGLTYQQQEVILRLNGSDNFGYDELGNQIDGNETVDGNITEFGPRHPVALAVYVQDNLRLSQVDIDFGLRYDYVNPDSWGLKNPQNVLFVDSLGTVASSSLVRTGALSQVSPRLTLSFAPDDMTRIRAGFWKFVQEPEYNYSYSGMGLMLTTLYGENLQDTRQAFGLTSETVTLYDVGVSREIGSGASIDVTAFYKFISNLVQGDYILPAVASNGMNPQNRSYYTLDNNGSSAIRGVELGVTLNPADRLHAQLGCTLASADFAQSSRGTLVLDYRYGKGDGGAILERSGIDVVAFYGSGYTNPMRLGFNALASYDYGFRFVPQKVPTITGPSIFEIDARVEKTVRLSVVDATFYIYVQNLLNAHNADNVFTNTGSPADNGWLESALGKAYLAAIPDPALYRELYTAVYLDSNSGNYQSPRQIRFGIRLNY